jgi:hypothetical protein
MRRTWVGATWRWCRLPSRKGRVALGGGGRSKPAIPRLIGSVFQMFIIGIFGYGYVASPCHCGQGVLRKTLVATIPISPHPH